MKRLGTMVIVAALFSASTVSAEELSPWTPSSGNHGWSLRGKSDGPYHLALQCSASSGFTAVLVNEKASFDKRILTIKAKVGSGNAVNLHADQDRFLPGLAKVKGIDALERDILRDGTLTILVDARGEDNVIQTFMFDGIQESAGAIEKICPAF